MKWRYLFIALFLLFFVTSVYDIYNPTNFLGLSVAPPSGEAADTLVALAFVGSLLVAGIITVILRVLYVGLNRLFS